MSDSIIGGNVDLSSGICSCSDTKSFNTYEEMERSVFSALETVQNFFLPMDSENEYELEPIQNCVLGIETSCLNVKVTESVRDSLGHEENCNFTSSNYFQHVSAHFEEVVPPSPYLVNSNIQSNDFSNTFTEPSGEFMRDIRATNLMTDEESLYSLPYEESEMSSRKSVNSINATREELYASSIQSHTYPPENAAHFKRMNSRQSAAQGHMSSATRSNQNIGGLPSYNPMRNKRPFSPPNCKIYDGSKHFHYSNPPSSSRAMPQMTTSSFVPVHTADQRGMSTIVSARNLMYGSTGAPTGNVYNHLANKSAPVNPSNAVSQHKKDENEMINSMLSEILDSNPNVKFDDVAGLDFIKNTVKEIVIWPFLRPDIFCGLRAPPKGLLLFGPPGTGKTLIGKCIATEAKATFFCISASSLTSKYVGEGEKLVRTMFTVARSHAPSVIFIDEIDSLLTQRSGGEQDYTRKLKTEFLVQFDGAKTSSEDRILVVGATNRPQELDEAARRRFVKRLYVPLPDFSARHQIVARLISKYSHELSSEDMDDICVKTEGYSCADISNLCQEAAMGPIRSSYAVLETISLKELRPICLPDFQEALKRIKSSVSEADIHAHLEFNKKFGCESF